MILNFLHKMAIESCCSSILLSTATVSTRFEYGKLIINFYLHSISKNTYIFSCIPE